MMCVHMICGWSEIIMNDVPQVMLCAIRHHNYSMMVVPSIMFDLHDKYSHITILSIWSCIMPCHVSTQQHVSQHMTCSYNTQVSGIHVKKCVQKVMTQFIQFYPHIHWYWIYAHTFPNLYVIGSIITRKRVYYYPLYYHLSMYLI